LGGRKSPGRCGTEGRENTKPDQSRGKGMGKKKGGNKKKRRIGVYTEGGRREKKIWKSGRRATGWVTHF